MSTPTAPAPDEEVLDAPAEPSQPTWRRLLTGSTTSIFLVLVALIAVFSLLQFNEFFTVSNLATSPLTRRCCWSSPPA